MKEALTREQILSADDLKTERVEVPEWGGAVIVKELTAAQRDTYEASVVKVEGTEVEIDSSNMRAKLAALSIVDETGKRLFTEKDIAELGKKSASAVDRVVDVARRMSKIGDDEVEDSKND